MQYRWFISATEVRWKEYQNWKSFHWIMKLGGDSKNVHKLLSVFSEQMGNNLCFFFQFAFLYICNILASLQYWLHWISLQIHRMLTLGCHKLILCISFKLLYTKNILLIIIKGTHSQFWMLQNMFIACEINYVVLTYIIWKCIQFLYPLYH